MNQETIKNKVKNGRISWQRHALERMLERNISRRDVKKVLTEGELIEDYPDDYPLPSGLFLGFIQDKPLHVVAAVDIDADQCYIITVYRPDLRYFKPDFKTRK